MPAKLTRIIKRLLFGVYNPRYYPAILNKHYLAVRNKKLQLDDNLIEKARDFYINNLIDFSPIETFEKTLRIMPRRCIDLDPHEFWSTSDMFDKEQAFFLHRFYWINENYDAKNHHIFNDLVD